MNRIHQNKKEEQKQLRQALICYFMAISQAQHQLQSLQNQLISYPYFNIFALFTKIAKITVTNTSISTMHLNYQDLIRYISKASKVNNIYAITGYLQKYQLYKKQCITWEQFLESIIPYTPDVLRNTKKTIVWQTLSTNKVSKRVQMIYQDLLKTQLFHLQKISYIRHKFFPKNITWSYLKQLIYTDLLEWSTHLQKRNIQLKLRKNTQNNQQPQLQMMDIRKWLQLSMNVNQFEILNMMRYMRGSTQGNIRRLFGIMMDIKEIGCNCSDGAMKSHNNYHNCNDRDINNKGKSKHKNKSKSRNNYSQNNNKSRTKTKSKSKKKFIKGLLPVSPSNKLNKPFKKVQQPDKQQQHIQLFHHYISTIQNSQQQIDKVMNSIQGINLKQIEQILNYYLFQMKKDIEINITTVAQIISFIQNNIRLINNEKSDIEDNLEGFSIEKDVLLQIFLTHVYECRINSGIIGNGYTQQQCGQYWPQRTSFNYKNNQNKPSHQQYSKQVIKQKIAMILKIYLLAKVTLMKLAQAIQVNKYINVIFQYLDYSGTNCLSKKNLKQILRKMNIPYTERQIQVLMRHFGDGTIIKKTSFKKVIENQVKI